MDMTKIQDKEGPLRVQGRENTRFPVDEVAAKEARCLKSQFLAHTTYEIRTPIADIMGWPKSLQIWSSLTSSGNVHTTSTSLPLVC
jgi:signal transduction histidine kinase